MNPGSDPQLHLGVMAKYWQPGSVKTRLGAAIGMHRAADLHRLFCHHLSVTLAQSATRRSFVIAPASRQPEFQAMLPNSWQIEFQSDGDLGRRMQTWFDPVANSSSVLHRVLIGADCPTLDGESIRIARAGLADHDLVLGPAVDGGYYMIGLRAPWRWQYEVLFADIPWSSESVFEITYRRAEQNGLRVATLPVMEDVDTVAELDRLIGVLESRCQNAASEERENSSHRLLQAIQQVLVGKEAS